MTLQDRQYNLLVYGIEKIGLGKPMQEISNSNFKLTFEPFNTGKRFNDFDGVILFQGIFETYEYKQGYGGTYLNHSYARDELDKRTKELGLLLNNGGFVCFILHKRFVDQFQQSGCTAKDLSATDLCKKTLNFKSFHRKDIGNRVTHIHCVRNEFKRFLELYGAASCYFENYDAGVGLREIAKINTAILGMVLFDNRFYIPSLIPENTVDRTIEYFSLLSEALTSSYNKLRVEIPLWASKFCFEQENALITKKEQLLKEIEDIDNKSAKYNQYKKVLIGGDETLKESVATLIKDGFRFKIDYTDEFKEDLKIINADNAPMVFLEVKGTNRSVKREYINQTDSHRERAKLDSNFPSLLVINTHIKNSKSIDDKDKSINEDQINHAVKMRVLIVRTLDLLYLLRHMDNGKISQQEIMELFCHKIGWLKVDSDRWEIIQ